MSYLNNCKLIAFAGTRDLNKAKAFYGNLLGLPLITDDGFAAVFDANGTMLRVTRVQEVTAAHYTVLGWEVSDIVAAVTSLREAGVTFERFAGVEQDDLAIWKAPGGAAQVAWFKDPDGNTLSVSQHPS